MTSPAEATERDKGQHLTSVALIEDNRVVREGLVALLNGVPGMRIVHAGSSFDLAPIQGVRPRVLLLDVGLENGDSLDLARRAGRELPDARVVMMDLLPAEEEIKDFVQAGVAGFIMKDASLDEFVRTIRTVAEGLDVLPDPLTGSLFSQIATHMISSRGSEGVSVDDVALTPREREVIDLISAGLSNKAISARLQISIHTVKSHVRNIMEKLALHTRLQVAAWAHEVEYEG